MPEVEEEAFFQRMLETLQVSDRRGEVSQKRSSALLFRDEHSLKSFNVTCDGKSVEL